MPRIDVGTVAPTRGKPDARRTLRVTLATWAPFVAGAEVAAERLAVGLQQAGHDVLLVVGTRGPAWERFCQAGLRCVYCPQRFTDKLTWLRYRSARNRLLRLLRQEQPDVVHSNDLPTHQMVSDAARRLGIPRICHHRWIFDGPAIDWFSKYGAERHLFVSQALMDDQCAKSGRLAASPRAVAYDGLPLPSLPTAADRSAARRELGLPQEKSLVTFAGQIIERKGVADLLHGWARIAEAWRGRAELLIIGDDLENAGAYRRKMEALAAELHCPARFFGFQSNVGKWLVASDLVVVPSHAEPLGNATLEAMAVGLPVIGSDVGGIPEMIVHGQSGVLVPPRSPHALAAAIEQLLFDPEQRRRLGQAARRRCEAIFSLEAHVRNVVAQYQAVLGSRSAMPATAMETTASMTHVPVAQPRSD